MCNDGDNESKLLDDLNRMKILYNNPYLVAHNGNLYDHRIIRSLMQRHYIYWRYI